MFYSHHIMKISSRAIVAIALTVSLAGLPSASHAAKAPTPGAKCAKAKLTQVSKGKTFTCIKTKNGLKWNKGVRVNSSTQTPSTSPSLTPSPTPTTSPIPVVSPTPTFSPTPVSTPTPTVTPSATASPTPTTTQVLYTMDQVRANNSNSSCWTVIDGYVYDLTRWISAHPGGPGVIRSLCGVDGTSSFKAQHENQRNPAQRLSSYLLGPLSK